MLLEAYEIEWSAAQAAKAMGDLTGAFAHLERAHILGQRSTRLHVRSHVGMLRIGWLRRDPGEVVGQLIRIAAAAVLSRIWVPHGNTGGANVSAFRSMPVPDDLRRILNDSGVG